MEQLTKDLKKKPQGVALRFYEINEFFIQQT